MSQLQVIPGNLDAQTRENIPVVVHKKGFPAGLMQCSMDFSCILVIPAIGCLFAATTESLPKNLLFWCLLSGVSVCLISSHGGYRQKALIRRYQSAQRAIGCYLAVSIAMLAAALLLGHVEAVSRYWTMGAVGGTPVLLFMVRTLPILKTSQQINAQRVNGPVIICYNQAPRDLTKALKALHIPGEISGLLYLSGQPEIKDTKGLPTIPNVGDLLALLRSKPVEDIIFIYQTELEFLGAATRNELLSALLAFPARIWLAFYLGPDLPPMLGGRGGDYKLVPIVTDHLVNSQNLTKRLFDLALGGVLLTASLPMLAVIALLVRLSGPGPVIFRQIRYGAQGKRFTVLKFRTMSHQTGSVFTQAVRGDQRVTWIGQFLRRSSLDELLQLINVLRGEMSMVGPRPHAPETQVEGISFEDAVKLYRLRYRVKPGITGLAQIRGHRGQTARLACLESRISSDLEYIETWSLWLDFSILLRTLPVMVASKNAY